MLRCLVLAFLAGCTSVGHRAAESLSPAVTLASVRFASPREVELARSEFSLATPRQPATGVVEVGGRVIELSEDSLVIYPDYLIMQDSTHRGGQQILWRGGDEALALVVVRPTSDMYLGPYRPPRSRRDVIAELVLRTPAWALFVAFLYGFFMHQ